MSEVDLVLPLVGLVLVGAVLSAYGKRVNLEVGALVSTFTLIVGAVAALPVLAHFVFGGLLELPRVGEFLHDVVHRDGSHVPVNLAVALLAGMWLVVAFCRVLGLVRTYRAGRHGPGGLTTIDTAEPVAYVVPGGSQAIVVSRGLLETLTPGEIDVVVAHESAHARLRHDRLLLVGHVAVAVVPLLYPVLRRLEFTLERIADESAVDACGDRRLVARTLAKVALARHPGALAPGIARMGTAARVRHLTADAPEASVVLSSAALLGVAPLALLGMLQWHHVALAVRHVCGW